MIHTSTLFLLLAAASAAASPAPAQSTATHSAAARNAWGFDRSDLQPHPDVRFGVLANGMRYALMRNAAPAGHLSVRMRIDAGATAEGAREQGFMHLIEHMIFHGSANLPQGALLFMLPHQGLRRWSDFNGYTSYEETVYRLDLTRADGGARATALTVMREIAGHLRFGRRAVAGAKDQVREEIGGREAGQDRLDAAQNAFFLPGTPLARGPVAGTRASVERAGGGALQRLYARHYVPGRATLVMVGDVDPVALEAEIVARFSDWRAGEPAAADARPVAFRANGATRTRAFVDAQVAPRVIIASVDPLGGPDAGARRDGAYLEHIGAELMARRLARSAGTSDAPFTAATSSVYDHYATARLAQIELAVREGDWRGAMRRGALELDRALRIGFSQAELDAQLAASQRALAEAATPRTSPALADAIVDAINRRLVFTAPADRAASAAYLSRVRLTDVQAAFRRTWANPHRSIFVSHDRAVAGGDGAVAAAWTQSLSAIAAD